MTGDPIETLGYMTNWSARLFARAMETRLKPLGFSPGQLPLFFALTANGPMSQKALVQIIGIEQPTMAATLSRMERDGLVKRRPDPKDGRGAIFSLTPKATRHADAIASAVHEINSIALDGVSEAERLIVLRVLRSAVDSIRASLAGSPSCSEQDG